MLIILEITLHLLGQSLVKLEGWENIVTIVSCDMRQWDAPEKADILVCGFSCGEYILSYLFVVSYAPL